MVKIPENTDKALYITSSIVASILTIFIVVCYNVRTWYFKRNEHIRHFNSLSVRILATVYGIWLFSLNFVMLEGYKYIGDAIVMKPTRSLIVNWIIVNLISCCLLLFGFFSYRRYLVFSYCTFVVQWIGQIIIVANQFVFTFHHVNTVLSVFMIIMSTYIVFRAPKKFYIDSERYPFNATPNEMEMLSNITTPTHVIEEEEGEEITDKGS